MQIGKDGQRNCSWVVNSNKLQEKMPGCIKQVTKDVLRESKEKQSDTQKES